MARKPSYPSFIGEYTKYVDGHARPTYDLAVKWLEEISAEQFWEQRATKIYGPGSPRVNKNEKLHPIPCPIYRVRHRIKFPDSAFKKLGKDARYGGLQLSNIKNLEDVVQARIVVYFPHQLRWIDTLIRESRDIEIAKEQPPKSFHDNETLERLGLDPKKFDSRNRKMSGYSSLHYVLKFAPKSFSSGSKPMLFELQVRTIAEELWGEIEHHIGYKPESRTAFSVQRQFKVISSHLQAVDMHLDFIYDEMQHFQSDRKVKKKDRLNAENLPFVLSKLGISIRQGELGTVTEILEMFKVIRVEQLDKRITYNNLEDVRNAWKQVLSDDEQPTAVMILHVLAWFSRPPSKSAVRGRVNALNMVYTAMRENYSVQEWTKDD